MGSPGVWCSKNPINPGVSVMFAGHIVHINHFGLVRTLVAAVAAFAILFLMAEKALSLAAPYREVYPARLAMNDSTDRCLSVLRTGHVSADPASFSSDDQAATGRVLAVSFVFGLRAAAGPVEKAESAAFAISDYRECKKQQALQADRFVM
jgi:hypothetical protein